MPNIEKLSGSGAITPVVTLIARTLPLPKSATNTLDPTTTMPPHAPVLRARGGGSRLLGVPSTTVTRSWLKLDTYANGAAIATDAALRRTAITPTRIPETRIVPENRLGSGRLVFMHHEQCRGNAKREST